MDIRPDYANVETDGVLTQVDPDEVEIGTVIVIQPGEKVPIDGVIVEGSSSLNTSALTGESAPRECREGDEIISGCINLSGLLKVRTTKEFGECTVSKILELVENASSRKSRSEEFISRFARVYTPAVVYSALALAILPPLVRGLILQLPAEWNIWLYRALTFLVISCPCALVISIPLSFFAGIGGASHEGVLIKGSNYLETLSQVRTMVFDKTGTLTQGVFEVSGVHHSPMEDEKLLEYAALVECASSHPISRSLQRAYGREIDRSRVTGIEEISGEGIIGNVDGHRVAAGNDKLMHRLKLDYRECRSVGTIIHMAVDGAYAGHIVISDLEKPNVKQAIKALRDAGVRRLVMLTGDVRSAARTLASSLNFDMVKAELSPEGKLSALEYLKDAQGEGAKLAYVGDGINDNAMIQAADLGIGMNALKNSFVLDDADVAIMGNNIQSIPAAVRIAMGADRAARVNLWCFAGIKLLGVLLALTGVLPFAVAGAAEMVLSSFTALYALRVYGLS